MEGRKRHLLVDTEGMVLKAKVHSAKVPDQQDGLRVLLESARSRFSRLKHLWVDAGYQGRGRRWAEEILGLSVEVVRKPPKPVFPRRWLRSLGQGVVQGRQGGGLAEVDATQRFPGLAEEVGGRAHLRLDLSQSQDELRDYERLCATGEAFVYVAMTRLMVRRLAHA